MYRKQIENIKEDLSKKMVFLTGPRQVGKTWIAKELAKNISSSVYLNYDSAEDRTVVAGHMWSPDTKLLIFDEIHKMPEWKNYLKGIFDTKPEKMQILVTGSARLETFRRSGDSLAGRFFLHRLLPLSFVELEGSEYKKSISRLMERGGFPEPFLATDEADAQRWRSQYLDSLIRTDVLDFENIHDLRAMNQLMELLPTKVGSPLSYASLARDLSLSNTTVKKYVDILEALYIVFRIRPYTKKIARSIQKEPKLYFFDVGIVKDEAARFENFIALSLLKDRYFLTDTTGVSHELFYLRTKEKREVDFALVKDGEIEHIVETKLREKKISEQLKYFTSRHDLVGKQVVLNLKQEKYTGPIDVVRADTHLAKLSL